MTESTRPRAAVLTLGCRVNQYESEAIEAKLEALGFELADFSEVCDVYIINTCAVTGESERKSRQMIRRAISRNPSGFVLVTGCFSQLKAEEVSRISGVDYICGNRNKGTAAEYAARLVKDGVKKGSAICAVSGLLEAPLEKLTLPHARRARAYVKIEDGCDNHCTYCIIRRARGGVVSRLPEEVLAQVRMLALDGCSEVILTGIETASYGKDIGGYPLSRLMAEVAHIDGIRRVRTGSLDPSVLTKPFCDEIAAQPHIMPSFHLSLQSGSNAVLAAMKRRYSRERVIENTAYLRSVMPKVTFTCDIIVGFPGETEEDFLATMDIAEKIGFLHMHIFPFSAREGTPAADMARQIPESLKQERLHRLKSLGEQISAAIYEKALGEIRHVLFETKDGDFYVGHSEDMLEVKMRSDEPIAGRILPVKLTDFDGIRLTAQPIL